MGIWFYYSTIAYNYHSPRRVTNPLVLPTPRIAAGTQHTYLHINYVKKFADLNEILVNRLKSSSVL